MPHLLIGCGYLGSRVARRWADRGDDFTVVARRPERADELRREGYRTVVGDATCPEVLASLPAADVVLLAVPGEVASRTLAAAGTLKRWGHPVLISSTGVYGDAAGDWVDETTLPAPTRPGARMALAAENALTRGPFDRRSIILRLGGIYGPDRVPHLEKLRTGKPLPVRSDGWLNLIHVDDAATAVLAAEATFGEDRSWLTAEQPRHSPGGASLDAPPAGPISAPAPRLVNITDGHPVLRGDYYAQIARLIGAPAPRFVPPPPGAPPAVRGADSRRVSNARMCHVLELTLHYPSYQEGLAAILGASPGCCGPSRGSAQ